MRAIKSISGIRRTAGGNPCIPEITSFEIIKISDKSGVNYMFCFESI